MKRTTRRRSGSHGGRRKSPILARLLRSLARRIEGRSGEASWADAEAPLASERLANPPPPRSVDLQAVDHLLTDIHKRGIKASVGKIQMVHVGVIRDAFGDAWDRYADRAMDLAEGVLRRHLDPTDIYSRYDNFAFIVVFADIDEAYAQERAAAISLEIQYRLLHDPKLSERISVNTVASRIVDMLGDEVPPTVGALSQELDRKAKEQGTIEKSEFPKLKRRRAGELPQWMGKFAPAYRPMLYLPEQTISTYVAVHRRRLKDGAWLVDEATYPGDRDRALTMEMDEILIRRVTADLRNALVEGDNVRVGAMVNIRSLNKSSPLFPQFHLLGNRARDRFVIELTGVQAGTPLGFLVEVVGSLRPFTKHVNLRLPLFEHQIERLATVGVYSVGCDISSGDLQQRRVGEIAYAMEGFAERANALDFHTHFHGVNSAELFAAAVRAGADYLTGDAVAPFIASPAGELQFQQVERAFPARSELDGHHASGSTAPQDAATRTDSQPIREA